MREAFGFSETLHYPFGMLQPERKYEAVSGYRYGFNGKENDNEVKGDGNQQDYGMRIYDPRLGRFLSVDPLMKNYPSWSPYPFSMNRPVDGIDVDGLEWMGAMWYMWAKRAGRPTQNQSTNTQTNEKVGINFSGAMIAKKEYTPVSSSSLVNIMMNGDKIQHNAVANLWNGLVQTTEDASNLAFSSAGRNAVGEKYAKAAMEGVRVVQKLSQSSPDEVLDKALNYLKTPEGAESALTFGYSILTAEATPAFKFPKLRIELPPGTQSLGFSMVRRVLKETPLAVNEMISGCESLAAKVQKSIGGEFLQITPSQGKFLGPVNYSGGQINGWAYHVAVLKDGMVYDGLTGAAGMKVADYKKMFEYASDLKFETTTQIKLK